MLGFVAIFLTSALAGPEHTIFVNNLGSSYNAFQVLGVDENAGQDAIEAAHKRLVKLYHPDRAKLLGADADRDEAIKRINVAWKQIGEAKARAEYKKRIAGAQSVSWSPSSRSFDPDEETRWRERGDGYRAYHDPYWDARLDQKLSHEDARKRGMESFRQAHTARLAERKTPLVAKEWAQMELIYRSIADPIETGAREEAALIMDRLLGRKGEVRRDIVDAMTFARRLQIEKKDQTIQAWIERLGRRYFLEDYFALWGMQSDAFYRLNDFIVYLEPAPKLRYLDEARRKVKNRRDVLFLARAHLSVLDFGPQFPKPEFLALVQDFENRYVPLFGRFGGSRQEFYRDLITGHIHGQNSDRVFYGLLGVLEAEGSRGSYRLIKKMRSKRIIEGKYADRARSALARLKAKKGRWAGVEPASCVLTAFSVRVRREFD